MRVEYHPRRIRDNYSLYIRPWDEIESMPAFFAMLRGIEKRFGRVREFRTGRVSASWFSVSCVCYSFVGVILYVLGYAVLYARPLS